MTQSFPVSARTAWDALTWQTRIRRWAALASGLVIALVWTFVWAGSVRAEKHGAAATPGPGQTGPPLNADEPAETKIWGTVRIVHDGTSLMLVTQEQGRFDVRLLGVEPPEPPRQGRNGSPPIPGQPFGVEAAAYVRDLLTDKQVWLDSYGKDRSGRILAVVWLGEINVNLTLVKEGLAWMDPSLTIIKVRAGLEVAERQAQVGKYGLWALPNPEPPWEYRKRYRLPGQ